MAHLKNYLVSVLWDLWCCASVVGIWPRFIEPRLLRTTHLTFATPKFEAIKGLKILHISDLHFHKRFSSRFLAKIRNKILCINPDLILFTGDFLCNGRLEDTSRLYTFLSSFNPPLGFFSVLGNHDYSTYVSRNREGNYDIKKSKNTHFVVKAIKQLLSKKNNDPQVTENAKNTLLHHGLVELLKKANCHLLHNETIQIKVGSSFLNITGLGDYWHGKCLPNHAFKNYNEAYPGLILSHNPDTIKYLKNFPGEIIFSGHTHGGQVNLPFICNVFLGIEDKRLKRGLFTFNDKHLYVTRGVGGHQDFRLFSTPELVAVTLC